MEQKEFFADLHIHSRFSRACSKDLNIANLVKWARIKGVGLLGTGDFTHPEWFKEVSEMEERDGILWYKDGGGEFPFIWQSEISLIYTQGKGRKVHLVILAPCRESVERIIEYLGSMGRLDYDGRPIFKISCRDFVAKMEEIDDRIEVIPAHVWTPYFGVFGSMSGFDSLKEAFLDKVERIHAIETGLSCYDRETEVLTKDGWKKFYNVENSDEVCTLNINSNIIEYQKPIKIFKYRYKGKMYKLRTKRVDLLVTPNHRLLVGHCDFRKPVTFSLREASEIFNKSKRFKKDGIWLEKSPEYFVLPEVKVKHGSKYYSGFRNKEEKKFLMENWLKFFGFWIAEGWTSEGKNSDYNVCICNNDKELLLEFREILESFGYTPYIKGNLLRIRDYQLFSYLRKFGKSREKFIPYEIKSLSKELLEIFFDYYIKGDGHRYGRSMKGLSATTISKRLRDDLQEIALKMGMSAYYKLHNRKGTLFKSPGYDYKKEYKQSTDSWVIYFIKKNIYTVLPSTIKKWNYNESWVDFDDDVFCVSVPNKVVYVRRKGIPVWCGNSDPKMNWKISELNGMSIVSFSDSHSFWPWRLGRECTIFKIEEGEELSYDLILKQIRENSFIGTVEVDPAYGKYHFDGHSNCKFSCSPEESKRLRGICPKCGRSLVIGVDNRVDKLANQSVDDVEDRKKYYTILPLPEIISLGIGVGMNSKKVWEVYDKMIEKFGNEFRILLEVSREELREVIDFKLVDLILKNRSGEIKVKPGYDGEYGVALLSEVEVSDKGEVQKRLF